MRIHKRVQLAKLGEQSGLVHADIGVIDLPDAVCVPGPFEEARQDGHLKLAGDLDKLPAARPVGNRLGKLEQFLFGKRLHEGVRRDRAFVKAHDFRPFVHGPAGQFANAGEVIGLVAVSVFKLSGGNPNIAHGVPSSVAAAGNRRYNRSKTGG